MLKLCLVVAACVAVLPSRLKILVLRHGFGFQIGKRVHIVSASLRRLAGVAA